MKVLPYGSHLRSIGRLGEKGAGSVAPYDRALDDSPSRDYEVDYRYEVR